MIEVAVFACQLRATLEDHSTVAHSRSVSAHIGEGTRRRRRRRSLPSFGRFLSWAFLARGEEMNQFLGLRLGAEF
jgi:hypothetical protein